MMKRPILTIILTSIICSIAISQPKWEDYIKRGDQALKLGKIATAMEQYIEAYNLIVECYPYSWIYEPSTVESLCGIVRVSLKADNPFNASAICDGKYSNNLSITFIAEWVYGDSTKFSYNIDKLIECKELCAKAHKLAGLEDKADKLNKEIESLKAILQSN